MKSTDAEGCARISGRPRVSVIVPSWNTRGTTLACLDAVASTAREVELECIVVENGSEDGSPMALREALGSMGIPTVLIENRENLGYAKACNQGLEVATAEFVLLLNSDCRLEPGALAQLVDFLEEHPGYGAVAPRLEDPSGEVQRACMNLPSFWTPLFHGGPLERLWPRSPALGRYFAKDFDYDVDGDVEQPPAACLLMRRERLVQLGGLDESLWLFFNDVDLCARLAEDGEPIRFLASARAVHEGGTSTARYGDFVARWHTDRLRYQRKHHGRLAGGLVKVCVLLSFLDHALAQGFQRLRGHRSEPLLPLGRRLAEFLRHA